jgi:hypothetical protein
MSCGASAGFSWEHATLAMSKQLQNIFVVRIVILRAAQHSQPPRISILPPLDAPHRLQSFSVRNGTGSAMAQKGDRQF